MRKINRNIVYRALTVLIPLLACCALSYAAGGDDAGSSVRKAKPFTVVIDAGHGGHDSGAIGRTVKEKDLNLTVSKMLGELISCEYPDVKLVFTRKTDVFLTLQQRADIVNKNNADLFICIHTNAAENRSVSGAETFVLGIDKMQSNLDVAMRENSVIMMEDNYESTYEGFDPKSVDSYIMFELLQDQYIDRSLQFATLVQQEFSVGLRRADRGVRQAGFWVLHKSACPSVLIEMGFISNAEEERYLASAKGKEEIANAIFNAFRAYKYKVTKDKGQSGSDNGTKDKVQSEPVQTAQDEGPNGPDEGTKAKVQSGKSSGVVYKIQIFTTTSALKKNDPTFKGLKNCQYTKDGKYYKYTYGEENDYQTIVDIQKQLKQKFKDCFIVAFHNGKQISVKEARKIQ